ncbi:hypothetical protein [Treponema sp. UBA3813]|uniref:hypothetical protein n=1 Tax=Treponema sp. UBA3813 TaxID=1947715 RepID=UPI0025F09F49|nr:hypothetical protein [Treponema sp. UBA3813]
MQIQSCIITENELKIFLEKYTLDYMQKSPHKRKQELNEFLSGKQLDEKCENLVREKIKWLDFYITYNKKENDNFHQNKTIHRRCFGSDDVMDHCPLGGFR